MILRAAPLAERAVTLAARALALAGLVIGLAACQEKAAPPPPVRPVLSVVVAPQTTRTFGYTGTIEPRVKVGLGFRVLGRIISRDVNVGDRVAQGTQLASIDPTALELGVRSATADVFTAQASLANATGVETRLRTLLEQNTTTPAQFEAAQQAQEAASAALKRANANLAKAREQLGYASMRSDIDGVVTAVDAQVGQVVSAGQSVVTVARPAIREAVVDVPDEIGGALKLGAAFDVSLQLDTAIRLAGRVRDVAPQADQTTRTRRVWIALDAPPDTFRLGTTVVAVLTTPTAPRIVLTRSALLERDGRTCVWVVDPAAKTVSIRDVALAPKTDLATTDGVVEIAGGLEPGTRVVTAGVNSLAAGQSVKILDEAR